MNIFKNLLKVFIGLLIICIVGYFAFTCGQV